LDAQLETIRAVNRTIREVAADPRIPADEDWGFFCECGCFTLVPRSTADFDAGVGVWAPGHPPRDV
jgi:hypothetical protein